MIPHEFQDEFTTWQGFDGVVHAVIQLGYSKSECDVFIGDLETCGVPRLIKREETVAGRPLTCIRCATLALQRT